MLPKPTSCVGCPMFGDGYGYVPDRLSPTTELVILAQNPGKDEERGERITHYDGKAPVYETVPPQPLIGATGYSLRQDYLPLTGVKEANVSFCNILKCRLVVNGKRTNNLPTGETLQQAIKHCTDAHLRIPESTKLIVAMGGPSFEFTQPALAKQVRKVKKSVTKEGEKEKGGLVSSWRGFQGPETYAGKPVFCVIHLADLFREPTQRIPARLDWKKVGRCLRSEWPKPIPPRLIATNDVEALNAAFDEAEKATHVACDTEFNPHTKFLNLIGLGWYREDGSIFGVQLQWVGNEAVTADVRSAFIRRLARLVKTVKVVFQNAKADLAVIEKNLHISSRYAYTAGIEDTMHMHSVLWSEMPHSLDFLASIYGEFPKLKHLQYVDELLYNWGDVIETLSAHKALMSEFKADPLTYKVYTSQSLPLIPITLRREEKGIRVNQDRLNALILKYDLLVTQFNHMAWAYAGYPLNLMSSGGDGQLAAHLRVYEGIDLSSVDEETISAERDKYLPFEREVEEKQGFTPEYVLQRIADGAHPLLELRAAAVYYSQALNQDLTPLVGKSRVYPSFRPDAQASGRWSTTKPALAKVPNDFLDLYIPDEGYLLFGADYDAQEPRIFMAEAKSQYLKAAFNENLDIHTLLVCDMFGWPHPTNKQNPHKAPEDAAWRAQVGWGGKEDKRRTVSKNVRYERYYMGSGKQAIKKAVKLGIAQEAMARASRLVIEQDPNVADFHREIKRNAKSKRVRSWNGRLRVCLGEAKSKAGLEKVEREMCNHKMQAGGVDILNGTVIEVCQKWEDVTLFYTRHDSFFFEIPVSKFTPELAEQIREIAERPRVINGMAVPFPCSWKTMDSNGQIQSYSFTKEAK